MDKKTRKKLEMKIWREKHPDFRTERTSEYHPAVTANGGARGTVMICLKQLTDEQVEKIAGMTGFEQGTALGKFARGEEF